MAKTNPVRMKTSSRLRDRRFSEVRIRLAGRIHGMASFFCGGEHYRLGSRFSRSMKMKINGVWAGLLLPVLRAGRQRADRVAELRRLWFGGEFPLLNGGTMRAGERQTGSHAAGKHIHCSGAALRQRRGGGAQA